MFIWNGHDYAVFICMTYSKYCILCICIKKYIKNGDPYDPDWLIRSNLANNNTEAKRIIKWKSRAKIVDSIILNHYPNEVYENIRREKVRFGVEDFDKFHSFMHRKFYNNGSIFC